jgi:serine/threonine protein kinase
LSDFISRKGLEKLPESFILQVLSQALSALAELHKHMLTEVDMEAAPTQQLDHRFICTRNIFLTSDSTIKLSELANLALSKTLPLLQNTYHWYQAPEALTGVYSPAADIWSLGVVLYELCTYDVPFKGRNAEEVQESMRKGLISGVPDGQYSAELREIIRKMMNFDPSRRPKATDLLENQIFQPISGMKWKKWVPKLINWEEMKENRVPIQRNPEEDYPFPCPSVVLPCSFEPMSPHFPSAIPPSSLRKYLLHYLNDKLEPAYSIVKQLFQPALAAKYSSKPFEDPLRAVLTKEEIVKYLPLLKVLCVREGKGRERKAGRALTDSRLSLSSVEQ